MKSARAILQLISVLAVLCVAAMPVVAAEGAGEGGDATSTLFKWINFAILAGIFIWLFGKVLPPSFKRSAELISAEISKSTKIRAEAERLLRDAQTKLAKLESEIAGLRADAEKETKAEASRIRELAKSDAEKVVAAAKAEIEAAEHAAKNELKLLTGKLAVDRAESLLAKQLNPQTHEALISGFAGSLEERPN